MKTKSILFCMLLTGHGVVAQEYVQQLSLTRPVSPGTISELKAINTINASNQVGPGATAAYTAGQSVTLQPGFVAQAGSVFKATVEAVASFRQPRDGPSWSARAYPNPFTEQTTVEYVTPSAGRVRHTLMDAKGQVLRQSEESDEKSAGPHHTQVEGNDLPAGIYLYQLQVGNESQTLRLLKKH